jgi:hypothetical protein
VAIYILYIYISAMSLAIIVLKQGIEIAYLLNLSTTTYNILYLCLSLEKDL